MDILDYRGYLDRVTGWVAERTGLVPGRTLMGEPDLPEGPDGCAAVYEDGGEWNQNHGEQRWKLTVVARGATLTDARLLLLMCLDGAVNGFEYASAEERGHILSVRVESLPAIEGRDRRGRVLARAGLEMALHSPRSE
ncbi:MAG: hypothetical protein N3A38_06330 [Planctomycetota bacterium]|nr:hypothetical protein [Planctomycetota bacterium]